MRAIALLSCIAVVAACAKADNKAADTQAAMAAPPPPPPAITMADVTGTWDVKGMNEKGDSTLITYTLNAPADTSKWKVTFADKRSAKIHLVAMGGDSMWVRSDKFPSQLRKGVTVWNEGAMHLKNGMLSGSTTAHYSVKTADSVLVLRLEGTRAAAPAAKK